MGVFQGHDLSLQEEYDPCDGLIQVGGGIIRVECLSGLPRYLNKALRIVISFTHPTFTGEPQQIVDW